MRAHVSRATSRSERTTTTTAPRATNPTTTGTAMAPATMRGTARHGRQPSPPSLTIAPSQVARVVEGYLLLRSLAAGQGAARHGYRRPGPLRRIPDVASIGSASEWGIRGHGAETRRRLARTLGRLYKPGPSCPR